MGYIGNTPAEKYQTLQKQSFTTSATTSYTLSYSVTNPQDIAVFINNVRQNPNSSYTVSGTTLTLSSATASTDVMYAVFLGKSVGTIAPALGSVTSSMLAPGAGGTSWQSVQTSSFTAVASKGYPCNTTSAAFTVTLPSSASVGDTIQLVDYAGTFATNNITLTSSAKIEGGTLNKALTTNREGVTITYADATQGWIATSGVNSGNQAIDPVLADFLVIAGGGGGSGSYYTGGGGAGGYRNSYSTETSGGGGSSEEGLLLTAGITYTITVGAGGAGGGANAVGANGSNSLISGSNITTITSIGGGTGGNNDAGVGGTNGGSGGGGQAGPGTVGTGGSGTINQGFNGGTGRDGGSTGGTGGGGGAGGAGGNGVTGNNGGNGGIGLASSITGSSVSRGGGGGGSTHNATAGVGTSGGGNGAKNDTSTQATAGTANTGGGGGSGNHAATANGGAGGSGVVILRMLTGAYSGTTSGSPTVSQSGTDTILVYNASGSYTA